MRLVAIQLATSGSASQRRLMPPRTIADSTQLNTCLGEMDRRRPLNSGGVAAEPIANGSTKAHQVRFA